MKPPMAKNKDLRNYCILPIEAVRDHRLHGTSAFSVLALICTYTDYLGVTWVSQGKIAQELGISRQAVWRQVKKLKEYGYLVEEKALNKWQTTKSLKVVFKNAPKDIEEAKANLTAGQQITVEEHRRQAANKFKEDAKATVNMTGGGETSEVAGGATPLGFTNEPYNDKSINYYNDEARQFCVMFLRSAESFGTPRIIQDRDVEVMSTWDQERPDPGEMGQDPPGSLEYCRDKSRDYARGIGYFANPVERVTTRKARSYNQDAKSLFQKAVRSTRG